MLYLIAVFRSRNETLYFANMFKSKGMQVSIVNTPKQAGQTCGISVKFDPKYLSYAKYFLSSKPFRAFQGIYRLTINGQNESFEKIVWIFIVYLNKIKLCEVV